MDTKYCDSWGRKESDTTELMKDYTSGYFMGYKTEFTD